MEVGQTAHFGGPEIRGKWRMGGLKVNRVLKEWGENAKSLIDSGAELRVALVADSE
jgi:hypothetical protein